MHKKVYSYMVKKLEKVKPSNAFWFTIILMAFIYNFNKTIFYRPVGIHQWRSCVSAGYASNYYHGAKFFKPETEAFIAEDMRSNTLILETPILYYTVGLLYKIFGHHEFIFRLFNALIGFLGMFYLFKTARLFLKNTIISLSLPIILFTSTVYIFYMHNFITDATAIAVSLIGFYHFYKFYDTKKYSSLLISMLFFTIAGLLKIQSLYIYSGIIAVFFIELFFRFYFGKNKERLFYRPWLSIALFSSVIIINFVWYYYAKSYSLSHDSIIRSTRISGAIWNFDSELISRIWDSFILSFERGHFHSPNFIYFTFLVFLHNLIFIKKHDRLLNALVIFTFIQVVLFNILFFESIGRCDYYNINSFVFVLFVFLNLFLYIQTHYPKIYKSKYLIIGVLIAGVFLIYRGQRGISKRYDDWHYHDSKPIIEKCGNITPYLRQLGIEREDKVYFTPDHSQNISLYLMDQYGNTDIGLKGFFNEKVEFLKDRDLKYIMICDKNKLEEYKQQSTHLNDSNKIGEFNGVYIFKIN